MKPYYTVKEEEEDEGRDRRSSSEESIDKIKGKKEEHKELKTKPSNPYIDQPTQRPLQSQSSQPVSMNSQPSLPCQRSLREKVGTKWRKYTKTCMFYILHACFHVFSPFSAYYSPHDIIAEKGPFTRTMRTLWGEGGSSGYVELVGADCWMV